MKSAGQEVGIDFTGKCDIRPNTTLSHVLMEYTRQVGGLTKQNQLAEMLFQGYFTDGDVLYLDKLLEYAESLGLNKDAAKTYLTNPDNKKAVIERASEWTMQGVSGVPQFRMNGQMVFSGAQHEHTFVRVFETIAQKYPLSNSVPSSM